MGYKFTAIAPPSGLKTTIKNFFIIEFDNEIPESDYLLPDGLPSFFYIQTDQPIYTSFGSKGMVSYLHEGLYIGYSNVAVRLIYTRATIWGISVYPTYFKLIFGESPLNILNQFRRLENLEFLHAVQTAFVQADNSAAKVFELFEAFVAQQLPDVFFGGNDVLQAFEKLICSDDNYLRVEELAKSLGYSTRHLNSRFKQYYGMSPKQYIKLVRLNRTLKHLQDVGKEKNLSYIAQEMDFHDQSHFIREFKSICGKTPKAVLTDVDSLAKQFRLF